ncbi:hypothetical protein M0R04_06865 [Candidatus Dojkabacteria bacterium]|jgi:hypothetical protein|nr:hypothetical protein [Candidatus Dojkabacteria bacterium]
MPARTIFLPEDKLRSLYLEEHYTIKQLCEYFGVSKRTIAHGFSEYNICKRTMSETQLLDLSNRKKHTLTKELLTDLYSIKQLNGTEISKMYNITPTVLVKLFKRFEIPIRTKQDQQKLILKNKNKDLLQAFIRKSNIIHNNKYDYSKITYTNSHSMVHIICPIHGEFTQLAYKHSQGNGCVKCANSYIPTTDDFIVRANIVHNNKYDYSQTKYNKYMEKLTIICSVHGNFKQSPSNHLRGTGCPKCAKSHYITTEEFIENAKVVHGNKYDYSLVKYKKCTEEVDIICKMHGQFRQIPSNHLSGCGCQKCGGVHIPSTAEFISRAKLIHGNIYDYSLVYYTKATTKIKIICSKHGVFKQTPSIHLRGGGCKKCVGNQSSSACISWLTHLVETEGIYIQHYDNIGEYKIPGTNYRVDGFCKDTNTVYEFYGDAFHGNPNKYKPSDLCHPYSKKLTAGHLYQQTSKRELLIKSLGYNIIMIWEADWNLLKKELK